MYAIIKKRGEYIWSKNYISLKKAEEKERDTVFENTEFWYIDSSIEDIKRHEEKAVWYDPYDQKREAHNKKNRTGRQVFAQKIRTGRGAV